MVKHGSIYKYIIYKEEMLREIKRDRRREITCNTFISPPHFTSVAALKIVRVFEQPSTGL